MPTAGSLRRDEQLAKLSPSKLDPLIDLLVVEQITAHPVRPTALVQRLAAELKVNVRDHWRPDAAWLSSFQKIQLENTFFRRIRQGPAFSFP